MAVTNRPFVKAHAAAGDTSTGRLIVRKLYWNGATDAGDDLELKDGAGTVILKIKAGSALSRDIDWPFGERSVDGLETDVIDAGTVEYVLA